MKRHVVLFTLVSIALCLSSCRMGREILKENTVNNNYHTDSVYLKTNTIYRDSVYVYQNDTLKLIERYKVIYKDSIKYRTVKDTVYIKEVKEAETVKEKISTKELILLLIVLGLVITLVFRM